MGPALDGSMQVYGPIWNNQQLIHEYSAKKDNVKDFFDIGWAQNHNISLSGVSSDNKMDYYLSYSFADDDGIMPKDYDTYKRNTIAFRSSYEPVDWLKVYSSVNFARSTTDAVGSFQGTSVIDGLYEMSRDVSIVDMKNTNLAFLLRRLILHLTVLRTLIGLWRTTTTIPTPNRFTVNCNWTSSRLNI